MTRMRWSVFAGVVLVVACAAAAGAQPLNAPHIGYVYPAGGQRGTTVQVRVGGRFLDTVSAAAVSGSGTHAQIVGVDKPLTPKELTELRDKLAEMQKTAKTPADRQDLAALRMRIGDSVRRNQNPVLSEMVTLSISIDADAEPGTAPDSTGTPRSACRTRSRSPSVPCRSSRRKRIRPATADRRVDDRAAGGRQRAPHSRRRRSRAVPAPPARAVRARRRGSLSLRGPQRAGPRLHRQRPRTDALPGRCRARLVPGDAHAPRRVGPRGRLRRRLPLPARPGPAREDPGRRRLRAGDQGRALSRPRGLRLPDRDRRIPVHHQHLPARRARRVEDAGAGGWMESAGRPGDDGRDRRGAWRIVRDSHRQRTAVQPRAVRRRHDARDGRTRAEHGREGRTAPHAPGHRQRTDPGIGRRGRLLVPGKGGPADRRRGPGAAARLAARLVTRADRPGRHTRRVQRRLRRQGVRPADASRRLAADGDAPRGRHLPAASRRRPASGRIRVRLSAADRPAAPRLRTARHAARNQRGRRNHDPDHGARGQARRVRGRHRHRPEGRAGRLRVERRRGTRRA